VVEHDLAKVGVEGSNPFARSRIFLIWRSSTKARCLSGLFAFWKGVVRGPRAAMAADAQQACNRTAPAGSKRAVTRFIVAKSALYTVGYHGIPDAAVQHTKRKNRLN
jgi:hypothetical protein